MIGKRSKDGSALRLDFVVYEINPKGMESKAGELVQRLSNVEKGPGTSVMVELVYGGWKGDSAHGGE